METTQRPQRRPRRWVRPLVGVLLGVLLILMFRAWRPMPPLNVDLYAGRPGTTYHSYATRYAAKLAELGVTARVIETDGALDNLTRLSASDGAAVALAQSGLEGQAKDPAALKGLVSIGSVAFEPLWLFARKDAGIRSIADLAGRRVAMGSRGSGSRAIAEVLLEAHGVRDKVDDVSPDELTGEAAADSLLASGVAAAFIVGGAESKPVGRLLREADVGMVPFVHAEAYAMRSEALAAIRVPRGLVDVAADIPKADLTMVAATTNIIASKELPGVLIGVLIDAARALNSKGSLESPRGKFPSMNYTSLPLSPDARRFYEEGPSTADRMLPYRAAAIVDQLVFVVVPALAILFGLLKVIPLLLGARFSLRNFMLCRRLVAVEVGIVKAEDPEALAAKLDAIDTESAALHVPPSKYADWLGLRQNVHDGRDRLERYASQANAPAS
jgi:TRAP transporter TAXI family solute receptor